MTRRGIPGGLRGILFDWDGTLLDSFQADSQAFLAMFREIGIAWGIEDLERHYSPDWYRMYRAARLPRARWKEADRIWGKHYRNSKPALLPGARRVLRALARRYELGLVTALRQMRIAPEASVYVGDAPEDVEMARRAGVAAIGCWEHFQSSRGCAR